MSETKIKVPDGMLKAANKSALDLNWKAHGTKVLTWGQQDSILPILEAALLWQRENAPVPTREQLDEIEIALDKQLDGGAPGPGGVWDGGIEATREWIRRMYDAPETNPVVTRVKETLTGCVLTAGDAVELMDAVRKCTRPEPEVPEAIADLLICKLGAQKGDSYSVPVDLDVVNKRIVEAHRRGQKAALK